MTLLIAGLFVFLGIHLVPAIPPVRAFLVARLGEDRYKAVFSLVSAIGLVAIVAGYAYSDDRSRVFAPLPAAKAAAPFVLIVSFILLAAANMRGHLRRIVRHPMLIGILLWSIVHLCANGDRTGTVLFGGFLAYAILDLASAVGRGAVKTFDPLVKHDIIAVFGGTAVALVVMTLHQILFGPIVVPFGI